MAALDRKERFNKALGAFKFWSELTGILTTWAILIAITIVTFRILDRLPDAFDPNANLFVMYVTGITAYVMAGGTIYYSGRVLWLIYCWVSLLHSDGAGWLTKTMDLSLSTFVSIFLFTGVAAIAVFVAETSMQIRALSDKIELVIEPPSREDFQSLTPNLPAQ